MVNVVRPQSKCQTRSDAPSTRSPLWRPVAGARGGRRQDREVEERRVSELDGLGLLDYLADVRATGAVMLFPDLEKTVNGYGAKVSKWFNGQWLRKRAGITNKRKVLYSTRHTFATRLKAADVQDHTISELVGHEVESMTVGRYGKKLELPKLRDAIERLDYRDALGAILRDADREGGQQ